MEEKKFEVAEEPKWRTRSGIDIPIKQLSNEHLQNAYIYARKKELFLFNRMGIFTAKVEELLQESERRGITLDEHTAEFSRRERMFRDKKRAKEQLTQGNPETAQPEDVKQLQTNV